MDRVGAQGVECCADRLRIDLAHEPADVLALAGAARTTVDPARLAHRIGERLGKVECGKLNFLQCNQPFPELLQGVGRALACTLAGALGVILDRFHC